MKRSRWDDESDEDERAKAKTAKKALKEAKKLKQSAPIDEHPSTSSLKPPSEKSTENDLQEMDSQLSVRKENVQQHLIGKKSATVSHIPSRSVENYERLNFIDQGTYGMVFRGRCLETNKVFALKQVKINPDEVAKIGFPQTAFREINILLALNHPNIVKVREMVIGSTIDKIYMVMDYCENDLRTCMHNNRQSFSTGEVSSLAMKQIYLCMINS